MSNSNTQVAWRYHNGTKHPNGYLLNYLHRYDPSKRPLLFKEYVNLEPILLPPDPPLPTMAALEGISVSVQQEGEERLPDFEEIASILHYSAGITKRIQYPPPWGEMAFRAAACTGALYHIELYLVCGDLQGLEAGVYHYTPMESALKQLRHGDYRSVLIEATDSEESIKKAPAILVLTHIPWRNACKYQSRAYRHAFWDSGTILSHTLAAASSYELPANVITGFLDDVVSQLLDLDNERELPITLAALGNTPQDAPEKPGELDSLSYEVIPIAEDEIAFSAIHEMHQASSLQEEAEVEAWRNAPGGEAQIETPNDLLKLEPLPLEDAPRNSLQSVITKRGSSRRFLQESISFQQLSTMLEIAVDALPLDFLSPQKVFLNQLYLIINAVEGIDPGAYVYHKDHNALERLNTGDFREQAGHLALDQDLGTDASASIYFMASLRDVLRQFGNRGYRAAQLEAAIRAGRIYLSAYALGLGATGLTFFDDEVTEFFSPHAMDKSVMFLIAVGVPAKRG